MNMRFLSVCSGIEAASVAWVPLGWKAVAFAEIETFPSAVLAYHYPNVPNLGDMRGISGVEFCGKIDILVGGTPCQSFSIAGRRRGLDDERGSLALEFVRIADESEPAFVVWENVPGVLSDRGNAFGCFLGALAGERSQLEPPGGRWTHAGYVLGPRRAIAWRVLDAQYFDLPQRRCRVYVVACPRNGADPREVLFEFGGVRRDTPPCREAQKNTARTIEAGFGRGCQTGQTTFDIMHASYVPEIVSQAISAKWSKGTSGPPGNEYHNFVVTPSAGNSLSSREAILAFHGSQDPCVLGDVTHPCGRNGGRETCVMQGSCVRRLTPRECERLQGFPDDYTAIVYRGKPAADSPRYKALGNSMAVPVMHWIGKRIIRCREASN